MKSVKNSLLSNNGSAWFRVDLHLHSPGVGSFKLPSGMNTDSEKDKVELVESYVEQLKSQNIKIGAIIDYQQIRTDWFSLIQKKAYEENIYIFPGIELSVNMGRKIHVSFIFEYDENPGAINKYILGLDKNPHTPLLNKRDHRDIDLKDIDFVLRDVKNKFSCIIYFPHPTDNSGILKELDPKKVAELLQLADAIEYVYEKDISRIISTGKIRPEFFNSFAVIENSDPKSIEEIGTKTRDGKVRSTYFKLSSVSIDAFKIALHDPEIRIRLYNKPDFCYDNISSIEINGRFLKDIRIDLNPEMTTLIGGRGVGKSALIEALRYALDLPVYSDLSFRTDFVTSVVGSGGEIKVKVNRYFGEKKQEYVVKRIIGHMPQVYNADENDIYPIEPKEIFDERSIPIVIGQKELYFLSINTEFLLHLVDELIGTEIQKDILKFKNLIGALEENGERIRDIEKKLSKREEYEQRLKTIEAHIKTYDNLKVKEKLRSHTDLMEDEKKLNDVKERIEEFLIKFTELFEQAIDSIESLIPSLKDSRSHLKDILITDTSVVLEQLLEDLKESKNNIDNVFKSKINVLNDLVEKWNDGKKPLIKEINKIKRELENQGLSPENYESIVNEKINIQPIIEKLSKLTEQQEELLNEREKIKNNIRGARSKIFKTRQKKLEEINKELKDRLQIDIKYEENREEFLKGIKGLLAGSNVRESVIKDIVNVEGLNIDGIELSKHIKKGKKHLVETLGLTETMAAKLCSWFSNNERLFKLETLFPEDKIIIKLKVGDQYRPLEELSVGQKATALLLLLFTQKNRILIIDQPEEDLDNRFIYEDVVKILREIKEKRQIIMATHNANIPVLGDSELIIVLNATSNYCNIEDMGSIDKESIRVSVKNIMEGGEEAFRKRAEKYGGL